MTKKSFVYTITDKNIDVTITYKCVKNILLRVKDYNTVLCSCPLTSSKETVITFINSKKDWIVKSVATLKKIEQTCTSLPLDGQAVKNNLTLSDITKFPDQKAPHYSLQWQKSALQCYRQRAMFLRKYFHDKHLPEFTIKGRAMKTLWGSCNRKTNTITLNWELYKANIDCIDYVIFHEMTHFFYINHDKKFYSYIQKYMSDYKDRVYHLNYKSGPRLF